MPTSSQGIDYVKNKPYWRNSWREDKWGGTVFACPSNYGDTNIMPGPGYSYGSTYEDGYAVGGNCTWWCYGRYEEFHGVKLPYWGNGASWGTNKSISNVGVGDVLVWSGRTYGHVQFVEAVNGDTITVSECYEGLGRDVACTIQYISKSNPQYGSTPFTFKGVYSGSGGGGGGDDPDDPPDPKPGGHWEYIEETIEVEVAADPVVYTDIYECGKDWPEESGTQDDPKAAEQISQSSSRTSQRWEPFNMYTYERILTYNQDGTIKWSDWGKEGLNNTWISGEPAYSGSVNTLYLGDQPNPQFGQGWEDTWY